MSNTDFYIYAHEDFPCDITDQSYKILGFTGMTASQYNIALYDTHLDNPVDNFYWSLQEFQKQFYVYRNLPLKKNVGFIQYRCEFPNQHQINWDEKLEQYDFVGMTLPISSVIDWVRGSEGLCTADAFDLMSIVCRRYPKMRSTVSKILNQNFLICRNCYVTKSEYFKQYVEFACSVIFEFCRDKRLDNDQDIVEYVTKNKDLYTDNEWVEGFNTPRYHSRIFGFASELLITIFFTYLSDCEGKKITLEPPVFLAESTIKY